MFKKFFALLGLALFIGAFSQRVHTIVKGDTPYNVSKKYGMTVQDLYELNPKIKDGTFRIDDTIFVKGKPSSKNSNHQNRSGKTGKIILQPKQTLYGIAKQYHLSVERIQKLNPSLKMQIGEEVTLPLENIEKYSDSSVVAPNDSEKNVPSKTSTLPTETSLSEENTYVVKKRDNYYRLSKKFNITQSELFALNPGLEETGLREGDRIIIKASDNSSNSIAKVETSQPKEEKREESKITTPPSDGYVTYTVEQGDTVFGILNRFGISLDELLELNPKLSNGLKEGMVLKIKKGDGTSYVKKTGNALNVVMMLPFGFDSNETKYRSMAADFLSGAKLAIERNAKKGLELSIQIVDAGSESNFKNTLSQINPDNTDLIIGPFFKSNLKQVLDKVERKKIPVVAPFANSEDLFGYSNLIIVETVDDVYAERIAKEVAQQYKGEKIVILAGSGTSIANQLKTSIEKSVKEANIEIVDSASKIIPDQNMMTGKNAPIIAVLASSKEQDANAFANQIIQLSKQDEKMKAFSMYYAPIFDKKSDDLSQAQLVYLMDRKINTEGTFEKQVLSDYQNKYCKAPGKYAVIGFDVINDILSRENKKREVFKNMNKVQTQLATKFEYVRQKNNGAYVNTGYRVIRLLPQ